MKNKRTCSWEWDIVSFGPGRPTGERVMLEYSLASQGKLRQAEKDSIDDPGPKADDFW